MAKLRSGPKRDEKKHQEIVEHISNWHSTPEPYRKEKSLSALAKSIGVHANTDFYTLADSAEVYHKCLLKTAGTAVVKAQDILEMLYNKAMDEGNTRSAEVYLEFVRKTITEEGILSKLQPVVNVGEVMNNVERATANLLELANTLKDKPTIEAVEEAQYTDDSTTHSDPQAEK